MSVTAHHQLISVLFFRQSSCSLLCPETILFIIVKSFEMKPEELFVFFFLPVIIKPLAMILLKNRISRVIISNLFQVIFECHKKDVTS